MRHPIRAALAALCVACVAVSVVATVDASAGRHHDASGPVVTVSPIPKGSALNTAFDRFRLHSLDGARLRPDRSDFAARTRSDAPLLLFLPATRSRPGQYRRFLFTALSLGYHVLGLDYWNLGRTLSGTCTADPRCYTLVQHNRFTGKSGAPFSAVHPGESITARFRDAISHLRDTDPHGGWQRFVGADDTINWRRIVVAGHSQGGGEAAYIAHIRRVKGAIMFSAPVESFGRSHARWMDHPGRTPVADEYAMDDVSDSFGSHILGSWRAMGLDGTRGPWRTSTAAPVHGHDPHAILTELSLSGPGTAHSRVIKDNTPLTVNGTPRLAALWKWMLLRFDPDGTHSASVKTAHAPANGDR